MKTFVIALLILFVGCASAPYRPDPIYMLNEIQAGRMKAEDVNKIYDDYRVARQEYEDSAGYKMTVGATLVGLSLVGVAAGGLSNCGYGYRGYPSGYNGYYGPGGKTIITTNPITGGGYQTVIKGYK